MLYCRETILAVVNRTGPRMQRFITMKDYRRFNIANMYVSPQFNLQNKNSSLSHDDDDDGGNTHYDTGLSPLQFISFMSENNLAR